MSVIPIQNIYAMLCYVWDVPLDNEHVAMCVEAVDSIHNLLASLLLHTVDHVLKRGLNRYYIDHEEEADAIRGRIVMDESIRRRSLLRKRLVCSYDVYSTNIPENQIIKGCISIMSKNEYVNADMRQALHMLSRSFANVTTINPRLSDFSRLQYHRNNRRYRLLMNICELIVAGLIANERDGNIRIHRFITDDRMADIYEKFVLRFFQHHLSKTQYIVHSHTIRWRMQPEHFENSSSLLPQMQPDIVIEDRVNNTQLIIDTKYYAETLVKSFRGGTLKARSAHLYQVYTYLSNSMFQGSKRGMLLYPTVALSVCESFPFSDHPIEVRTLDLDQDWFAIKKTLLGMVEQAPS